MTSPLRARVQGGRLVLDEPTDLPEGTEIELVPAEGADDLDPEDCARLHRALLASDQDIARGHVKPASQVLADIARS